MGQNLPDALALRDLKYGEKTADKQRVAVADRLLEAGRIAEALDLYLIAGHREGIAEGKKRGVKEGHPVLLSMLRRAGQEVTAEEWRAAGEAAFAAGRWRQAYRCFTEAGDEAGLEKVHEKLPGYELYTPQGK